MPDTLRSRVARILAGSAHALLDKLEDVSPSAMLEQSVREVDSVIEEVRSEKWAAPLPTATWRSSNTRGSIAITLR
jgi:hypothetical protein